MNSTCMNFIPIAIKICTSGIGTSGDCTSGGLPVSETVLSGDPLYQVVVEVTHRLFKDSFKKKYRLFLSNNTDAKCAVKN